ncbi:Dtr1 [Kluyveromyces lactis]|nr:Dtr1 [Kluyveromyces lactis]
MGVNRSNSILSSGSHNSKTIQNIEKKMEGLPSPLISASNISINPNENRLEKESDMTDISEIKDTDFDSDKSKEDQSSTVRNEKHPETAFTALEPEIAYNPPYSAFSNNQVVSILLIIIYIGFLGPVTGNIYIPALPILQSEFNTSTTAINGTVAAFMGVFAVGPFLWAVHADFGGRKFLYIFSLMIALIANVLLAAVPKHLAALYILRVFQAIGTSAVIPLGVGTVSDLISPMNRAKGVSYFMLGPNMGPILGPIFGGLILMNGNQWRWLFGFTSITTGVGLILIVTFLPETLRCIVGNGDPRWKEDPEFPASLSIEEYSQTKEESVVKPHMQLFHDLGLQKPVNDTPLFAKLYPRPPKPTWRSYYLTFLELRVIICSISTAILFSSYYCFSVILSHELHSRFGFNNLQIGACYVCPGIGLLCGSLSGGHLSDFFKAKSKKWIPEYRLWFQIWGLAISMAGCCGFGWAIEKELHIVVILVFSFLLAFGMTWCSNATMTFLTELDRKKTATLVSISSFFRNAAAAVASAIVFKLIEAMGAGWCFTGLAFCDCATIAGIVYLMIKGKKRRQSSQSGV